MPPLTKDEIDAIVMKLEQDEEQQGLLLNIVLALTNDDLHFMSTRTERGILAALRARLPEPALPAAAPEVFNNIVLYLPNADTQGYNSYKLKRTTREQLAEKVEWLHNNTVVVVPKKPSRILFESEGQPSDGAYWIEDVPLEDGAQLAVVLDSPSAALSTLSVSDMLRRLGSTDVGNVTTADRFRVADWAGQKLAAAPDQQDVKRWYLKQLSLTTRSITREVEFDGLAHSRTHVMFVHSAPTITLECVTNLYHAGVMFKALVQAKAPNSEDFRDAAGNVKQVLLVLMADGWSSDEREVQHCKNMMADYGIYPALPRGDTHDFGDSQHPWPPPGAPLLPPAVPAWPREQPHASSGPATAAAFSMTVARHDGSALHSPPGLQRTVHRPPVVVPRLSVVVPHLRNARWVKSGAVRRV